MPALQLTKQHSTPSADILTFEAVDGAAKGRQFNTRFAPGQAQVDAGRAAATEAAVAFEEGHRDWHRAARAGMLTAVGAFSDRLSRDPEYARGWEAARGYFARQGRRHAWVGPTWPELLPTLTAGALATLINLLDGLGRGDEYTTGDPNAANLAVWLHEKLEARTSIAAWHLLSVPGAMGPLGKKAAEARRLYTPAPATRANQAPAVSPEAEAAADALESEIADQIGGPEAAADLIWARVPVAALWRLAHINTEPSVDFPAGAFMYHGRAVIGLDLGAMRGTFALALEGLAHPLTLAASPKACMFW